MPFASTAKHDACAVSEQHASRLAGEIATRKLVLAAQAGDQAAMRELYVRHAAGVYAHALRIVGEPHDAEDVAQHVFAKLLTELGRYRPGAAPFRAWLLRITHNAAIDHVRRARSTPFEQVPEPDTRGRDVAEHARSSLRTALAELPSDQRDVLLLTHLVGLSPTEIADRLGRSVRSVHGLHYRGRVAAREALHELGSAPATVTPLEPRRRRRLERDMQALSA